MRHATIVGIFTVMLMLVSGLAFAELVCPPGTVAVEDEAGVVIGCGLSEANTTKSEETGPAPIVCEGECPEDLDGNPAGAPD